MSAHHQSAAWSAVRRRMRPILRAGLPAPCTICRRAVLPEDSWQIDHIRPVSKGGTDEAWNLGAAHRRCNAKAGGTLGAIKTNNKRKRKTQVPNW